MSGQAKNSTKWEIAKILCPMIPIISITF